MKIVVRFFILIAVIGWLLSWAIIVILFGFDKWQRVMDDLIEKID